MKKIKEIIEQEIKWCEEHRGMKGEVYEEAFIAGLKQVLFFINSIQEGERSDTELDIVLASYRDMFGVKTDRANEIHRLACEEVAMLRANQQSYVLDGATPEGFCKCGTSIDHHAGMGCLYRSATEA